MSRRAFWKRLGKPHPRARSARSEYNCNFSYIAFFIVLFRVACLVCEYELCILFCLFLVRVTWQYSNLFLCKYGNNARKMKGDITMWWLLWLCGANKNIFLPHFDFVTLFCLAMSSIQRDNYFENSVWVEMHRIIFK